MCQSDTLVLKWVDKVYQSVFRGKGSAGTRDIYIYTHILPIYEIKINMAIV